MDKKNAALLPFLDISLEKIQLLIASIYHLELQ